MARKVIMGAALLVAGAAFVDLGFRLGQPALERTGSALMVVAGIGLAYLPMALGSRRRLGPALYWGGTVLASLVDVPAILDPTDLRAGRLLGFPAMALLSAGLILLWRERRDPALLVAAAWFVVQLPLNVIFFIIPTERPLFVLQVIGVAAALTVAVSRSPVGRAREMAI